MVEQLVDVLQLVDARVPVAEQVIEVPEIILENIPVRTLVREPQLVEQLVEVPTILTPPFIRMLQNVDTPVPHGGRGASGDNPFPRGGGRRLQGFLPEQSATALTVEQNVDIPVPDESLQDLRAGQSFASSSHSPAGVADDAFEGFLRTFQQVKINRHTDELSCSHPRRPLDLPAASSVFRPLDPSFSVLVMQGIRPSPILASTGFHLTRGFT